MARAEEEDPIRCQEAAGEIPAVGIPKCHGNDELVTLNSRLQFAEALFGDHRFWGDNEDERLRRFDPAQYPFRPVGGWFNVGPVHPDVHAPFRQRLLELVNERRIGGEAPVGDEGIEPGSPGKLVVTPGNDPGLGRCCWSRPIIVDGRHRS